jgi:hypothetical protein
VGASRTHIVPRLYLLHRTVRAEGVADGWRLGCTGCAQAIEEEEEEDEDDDLYDDGTLTRHEVKFGKEPPPKPATPKKGVSVRSLAAKAKAARTTDPIITLTPGWRNRCARGEAPRPSWDMEPAWEGEELLMLDARGRLQVSEPFFIRPATRHCAALCVTGRYDGRCNAPHRALHAVRY